MFGVQFFGKQPNVLQHEVVERILLLVDHSLHGIPQCGFCRQMNSIHIYTSSRCIRFDSGYVYQIDRTIQRWLGLVMGQSLPLQHGEEIDLVCRFVDSELLKNPNLFSWNKSATGINYHSQLRFGSRSAGKLPRSSSGKIQKSISTFHV